MDDKVRGLVIVLAIFFLMSACSKSKGKHKVEEQKEEKAIKESTNKISGSITIKDLDKKKDKEEEVVVIWRYYKKWNKKTNRLYNLFPEKEKHKYKVYYKVAFNNKEQPVSIIAYSSPSNIEKLKVTFSYNSRGSIRTKALFTKSKLLGKIKVLTTFDPLGNKKKEIIYKIENISSKIIEKEFYSNGKVYKASLYDKTGQTTEYSIFKYDKNKKLSSKTSYSRDIKLLESPYYYDKLYIDYIESYNKKGLVNKKKWFYKEANPGKLYFTDKYNYLENGNVIVNSYDIKNKLIHIKEFNKDGKVIKSKLLD